MGILAALGGALGIAKGAAGVAAGLGGGGGGIDVRKSLQDFTAMVPEINFNKIVREPMETRGRIARAKPEDLANRALQFTVKTAVPGLTEAAEAITMSNVEMTKTGIAELFPDYEEGMSAMGRNIRDRQEGRLTVGSRRIISRSLASSGGLRSLGPEATNQAFTGFLGMAAEDQAARGDAMMLQAVPTIRNMFRVTGAEELLGYGGLTTGQAIQTQLAENERLQQAFQFDVSTRLNKDLNMANLTMSDRNFRYNYGLQATGLMLNNQQVMNAQSAQNASMIQGGLTTLGENFGTIDASIREMRRTSSASEAAGNPGPFRRMLGLPSRT